MSDARSSPCGTFISNTMIVMMMAMTPSLNASSRVFSKGELLLEEGNASS